MNFLLNTFKTFAEIFSKSFKFGEVAAKEVILNKTPDETDPKTNPETTQKIRQEKEVTAMKQELKRKRQASKNKAYSRDR
jgi:hypothetical protein